MSVTIEAIDGIDKALVTYNGQAARTIEIGSDWNELTIAARVTLVNTSANLLLGPKLCIGLMPAPSANVANGPLSGAGCQHYLGTWHPGSGSPTWTYSASPDRYSGQIYIYKMIGTTGTYGNFQNSVPWSATPTIRKTVLMSYKKGSPNWTVYMWTLTSWSTVDQTLEGFQNAVAVGTNFAVPVGTGFAAALGESSYSGASASIAVSEATNGYLTSAVFAWDRLSGARFHDVAWAKFA